MAEATELLLQENAQLSERLAALEFALESMDWRLLTTQAEQEFSREGLRIITELSRIFWLKNPLIKRGVNVQTLYVWGQGMSIRAADPEIQAVIGAFLDDPANQVELTGHQARQQKEIELQTAGNLFLVLFPNPTTGQVRLRSIDFNEIDDIICNPQDSKDPWYYRRCWVETAINFDTGAQTQTPRTAYYPDWRYTPAVKTPTIGGHPVQWQSPIYHIKVGGFSNWKFGVSEIYAAIDWSKAYKEFLEDWASIVRAYRKFAFQLTTPGGKSGIAAAKAKFGTTLGSGGGAETNPPPTAGSTFIAGDGVNLTPVRTSGATVAAEDGRRILLMVAAAVGLPETFFGDVSVGTLATANSLDRPTELAMKNRQMLWTDIHLQIFGYVLLTAMQANKLPGLGRIERVAEGDLITERVIWNEGINSHIDLDFPPIVQGDTEAQVRAIIGAATLDGKTPAGTVGLADVARMLLVALGEDDIDEVLERMFDEDGNPLAPTPDPGNQPPTRPQAEALMVAAVRELRDHLIRLREAGQ